MYLLVNTIINTHKAYVNAQIFLKILATFLHTCIDMDIQRSYYYPRSQEKQVSDERHPPEPAMTATQTVKIALAGLAEYVRTEDGVMVFQAKKLAAIEQALRVAEKIESRFGIQVQVTF